MNAQVTPSLSFIESIIICFKNYCNCSGRARRSEFWYFYICSVIIILILTCCSVTFLEYKCYKNSSYYYYYETCSYEYESGYYPYIIFVSIVDLILFIPLVSASTRRLHDTGRPGTYYFICILPFGIFVLWYMWAQEGTIGNNIYGGSPKYPNATVPLVVAPAVVVKTPVVQPVVYPPPQQPMVPMTNNAQTVPVANPNTMGQPPAQPQVLDMQNNSYPNQAPQQAPMDYPPLNQQQPPMGYPPSNQQNYY